MILFCCLTLIVTVVGGRLLRTARESEGPAPGGEKVAVGPTAILPSKATGSPQARGRLVFQVHCARCHGPEGRGDGPDSATLKPLPRNLTGRNWRTPATADSIRKVVVEGLPGSMMPALGPALSPAEIEAVVGFVRSLAPEPEGTAGDGVTTPLKAAGFAPVPGRRPAPDFRLVDPAGRPVTLGDFRGRRVLLVFWGTSCAPCLEELPELRSVAGHDGMDGPAVLPVCVDAPDPETARSVAGATAPGLLTYHDPGGTINLAYEVQTLPAAVLIDREGRWLGRAGGAIDWSAPAVRALLFDRGE